MNTRVFAMGAVPHCDIVSAVNRQPVVAHMSTAAMCHETHSQEARLVR